MRNERKEVEQMIGYKFYNGRKKAKPARFRKLKGLK